MCKETWLWMVLCFGCHPVKLCLWMLDSSFPCRLTVPNRLGLKLMPHLYSQSLGHHGKVDSRGHRPALRSPNLFQNRKKLCVVEAHFGFSYMPSLKASAFFNGISGALQTYQALIQIHPPHCGKVGDPPKAVFHVFFNGLAQWWYWIQYIWIRYVKRVGHCLSIKKSIKTGKNMKNRDRLFILLAKFQSYPNISNLHRFVWKYDTPKFKIPWLIIIIISTTKC